MNLYAYCANNPVNWIDPWGLVMLPGDEETEREWGIGPGCPGLESGMPGAPDYGDWCDSLPPKELIPPYPGEITPGEVASGVAWGVGSAAAVAITGATAPVVIGTGVIITVTAIVAEELGDLLDECPEK